MRWGGILLCVLFGLACAPSEPRGVVLVVVDTLRADHLGSYGYSRPTSPRLDALAAEGVRFANATSPSPWTLPSLATLMTSLAPTVHGAHSPSDLGNLEWYFTPGQYRAFSKLHESRTTLAEILRDAGYQTFGAVQGSYPTRAFGMSQGFDVYRENQTPGLRFDIEDAFAWLDEKRPDRFLVYLHPQEVHAPYTPIAIRAGAHRKLEKERMPYYEEAVAEERLRFLQWNFDPDYRGSVDGSLANLGELSAPGRRVRPKDLRHLVALYDRGIRYVDHWIGELLDGLAARGLAEGTIVIVTADHGEEFLEHGRFEHSYSYYEEMLGVPLILRVPGEGRGSVVEQTVGLVDVVPTLLDLLDVSAPDGLQGRSLRPLWRGEHGPPVEYVGEASFESDHLALHSTRWKYVWRSDGRDELYDLAADPRERVNVCAIHKACSEHRERLLARIAEQRELAGGLAAPEAAEIDDATLEELKALGYLEP
jgi:arylsulfatase A-like enzyme